MKKRGVRFQLPYDIFIQISDVLKHFNVEDYNWYINNIEVYTRGGEDRVWDFELPKVESGLDFKKRINKGQYNMVFGEFSAFPKGIKLYELNIYEEFLKSSAEIVILVVDGHYYDVYCKSALFIDMLYKELNDLGAKEVEYIDENDARYKLSVW